MQGNTYLYLFIIHIGCTFVHVCISICFCSLSKARQLGILPSKEVGGDRAQSQPQPAPEDGTDLRSKLDSKPRQLLVINSVADKDLLVKYFEVSIHSL